MSRSIEIPIWEKRYNSNRDGTLESTSRMKSLSTTFTRQRSTTNLLDHNHPHTSTVRSFYSLLQPHPQSSEDNEESLYYDIIHQSDGGQDPRGNNSTRPWKESRFPPINGSLERLSRERREDRGPRNDSSVYLSRAARNAASLAVIAVQISH